MPAPVASRKWIALAAACCCASMLSGCGTATTAHLSLAVPADVAFALVDARVDVPAAARAQPRAGRMATTLGETDVFPRPVEAVRAALHARAGASLIGKTIALTDFSVAVDDPGGRAGPGVMIVPDKVGPAVGTAAAAIPIVSVIDSSRARKTVIAAVAVTIDDVSFNGQAHRTFTGRVTDEDIAATLQSALDDLTDQVRNRP